jgi:hypothetical protein
MKNYQKRILYIFLIVFQEHSMMKDEETLTSKFQQCEQDEREYFSILSSAVKESHEKERLQAERTKYWSIIGSILGTVLGVVGSTINNRYKMSEFRNMLTDAVTTEERVELLVSEKFADRLNAKVNSTVVATKSSEKHLNREELEFFYDRIVNEFATRDKRQQYKEDVLLGTAVSVGAAYLLYKLFF